jgi:hypothetical protein
MSESSDDLAKQIAALEAALQLPLPEESRRQLMSNVQALRKQQAPQAAVQGITEVSGTLHGNAIGVNYGTVQTVFGPAHAAAGTSASDVSQEAITDQRELLAGHRRTLAIYLKQLATLGSAYAPPIIANGIREAREGIGRAKAALRAWRVEVEDMPDDQGA